MNWKNWPYWARGGTIGFVVTIALYYGILLATTNDVTPPICYYDGGWEMIGKKCSTTEFLVVNYNEEVIIATLSSAILGWFYGKIKNRKGIA